MWLQDKPDSYSLDSMGYTPLIGLIHNVEMYIIWFYTVLMICVTEYTIRRFLLLMIEMGFIQELALDDKMKRCFSGVVLARSIFWFKGLVWHYQKLLCS